MSMEGEVKQNVKKLSKGVLELKVRNMLLFYSWNDYFDIESMYEDRNEGLINYYLLLLM